MRTRILLLAVLVALPMFAQRQRVARPAQLRDDGTTVTLPPGRNLAIGTTMLGADADHWFRVTPPYNAAWPGWVSDISGGSTRGFGFTLATTRLPLLVPGLIETDTGIVVNHGTAQKGRWGFHLFDGWGKDVGLRLSMIAGKHANTASIYYFKQSDNTYHALQLGSDEPGNGLFAKHRAVGINVPDPLYELDLAGTMAIKQAADTGVTALVLWNSGATGAGAIRRNATADGALVLRNNAIDTLLVQGGNVALPAAGKGVIVKSPDGNTCKSIGIDNAGALALTAATCPQAP
jgi:hypothetical protein